MKPHWLIPAKAFESYETYLKEAGAQAVSKARAMKPEDIVEEISKSGLRGRGGAGFPTGKKWATILNHSCKKRTVVCNAAEGEPGTFKDRYLIRKNPYAVLEGMLIAAHVVGATGLYIAVKKSFDKEALRLDRALAEMSSVMGPIRAAIVKGPEEYLFGEEKALLEVIQGAAPLPREAHNPPYEKGLFATPDSPNPALVNNAETFARVPGIIRHGADSFKALGTPDTPGTLLFTICGDVRLPGVYEREAGVTLRRLFNDVAGGPVEGRKFKAALSGVSNGILREEQFDTPAEFGALAKIGSGLGSAGFIVLDEAASIPRVAQAVARFLYVESCEQCTACKAGLRTASEGLDRGEDLEKILQAARSAPQGNRCYLPVQGSKLIPSLVESFGAEFPGQARIPPWTLPKIEDFIEEGHWFVFDTKQAVKQPDWTFGERKETRRRTRIMKAAVAKPMTFNIDADVQAMLGKQSGDVHRLVNEAIRNWLKFR